MTEILKNQAIVTVPGTLSGGCLTLPDGRQPRTFLHPRVKGWLCRQMLPLELKADFRCWPRYNRDGLKSLTVVNVAPAEQGGIVAGKVIKVDAGRLTVLVKPKSERVNPFHVQLAYGDDLNPKRGWRTRFEVVWQGGELVITGWQSLAPDLALSAASPAVPKPLPQQPKRVSEAEQMARANYAALMAQAATASDPRMKRQFEALAGAVLAKSGLSAEEIAA